MKRVIYTSLICTVLILGLSGGGCDTMKGVVSPLHNPPSAEQLQLEQDNAALKVSRLARTAVDEANALLIVINNRIKEKAAARAYPKKRLEEILKQTEPYERRLDQANQALALGNYSDAQVQADMLMALLRKIQAELSQG